MQFKLTRDFIIATSLLLALLIGQAAGVVPRVDGAVQGVFPHTRATPVAAFTLLASFPAAVFFLAIFVAVDVKRDGKPSRETLLLLASMVVSTAIVVLLKALFQTPRPGEPAVHEQVFSAILHADRFAFPSGHATRASLLAVYLQKRWPRYSPLWWAYAFAIAASRLVLNVHWLGDVLFGLILGVWTYLLVELAVGDWMPVYRRLTGGVQR